MARRRIDWTLPHGQSVELNRSTMMRLSQSQRAAAGAGVAVDRPGDQAVMSQLNPKTANNPDTFLARVTGHERMNPDVANFRWRYAWTEVRLVLDAGIELLRANRISQEPVCLAPTSDDPTVRNRCEDGVEDKGGGRRGEVGVNYALNVCELSHQINPGAGRTYLISGTNINGDDGYPPNVIPLPVGAENRDGAAVHHTDTVVVMRQEMDRNGAWVYWFDRANVHDGTC